MRIRVDYTVDVDDNYRAAIRRFYGKTGLATREEVREWLMGYGSSLDDDMGRDPDE